jgi:hypothetical protein
VSVSIVFNNDRILFENGAIAFDLDCCCGTGNTCCAGNFTAPSNVEVTFTGVESNGCNNCENINNVPFIVPFFTGNIFGCFYDEEYDVNIGPGDAPGSCWPRMRIQAQMLGPDLRITLLEASDAPQDTGWSSIFEGPIPPGDCKNYDTVLPHFLDILTGAPPGCENSGNGTAHWVSLP